MVQIEGILVGEYPDYFGVVYTDTASGIGQLDPPIRF